MQLNDIKEEVFFTPEELAERLKLSTATIYKQIGLGKLPYFSIGKSYRIPAQAFAAYMMRSGNIAEFTKAAPKIPDAAMRFVQELEASPGKTKDRIVAVVLFGSYARGNFDEESDIDLLVLVDKNTSDIGLSVSKISTDAMASGDYDDFLSPIRMSLTHWKRLGENGSPLFEEIQREGIVLWPKGLESPKDIARERARS